MKAQRSPHYLLFMVIPGFALLLGGHPLAWSRDDDSHESRNINAATRVLNQLQAELVQAVQERRSAAQRNGQAKQKLGEAKEQAIERLQSSADFQVASNQTHELNSKLADARRQAQAILDADKSYQAAFRSFEAAKLRQREAQSSDNVDETRKVAARELLEAKKELRSLEEQALLKIPGANDWLEQLEDCQQRMAELNHRFQNEIDRDPSILSAKSECAECFKTVQAANANVNRVQNAIVQQQRFLRQLEIAKRAAEAREKSASGAKSQREREDLKQKSEAWRKGTYRPPLPFPFR